MIVSHESTPIQYTPNILSGNAATLRFVEFLTGACDAPMCWRTVCDPPGSKGEAEKLGPAPLATVAPSLDDAQKRQHGIFAVVNAGGQTTAAIDHVRALYIDMDGEKTGGRRWQEMLWHVRPHFLVVRDDTHFHPYWLVDDAFPIGRFTSTQKRLINHYGSDPAICDLPRVMRVPGFRHLKDPDFPKDVILVDLAPHASELWGGIAALRLSLADLTAGLPELIDSSTGKPALKAREDLELDLEINIKEARRHLKTYKPANAISQGGVNPGGVDGDTYTVITANCIMDFGVSPETTFELLTASSDGEPSWNERCNPPWHHDELWRKVQSAAASRQNDIGCRAVDDASKRFAKWVELSGADPDQANFFDPWEEMPVPAFPLDTLPPTLRTYVEFQSRSIGADPAAIAMAALVACSGAIDHTFSLKMQQHGGWVEQPRLWALLVGRPSTKKTPIIGACVKPLRAAEARAVEKHKQAVWAWGIDKLNCPALEAPKPAIRYLAGDATSEKAAEILSHQDRGLLVVRDELASWLGAMEKYGGKGAAADRGFWLEAYNGGSYSVDRVSRGSIHANNCSVSFLSGIQPRRLAELGNLESDGLLQRFLPVIMSKAGMGEDIPDNGALAAYDELIGSLIRLTGRRVVMSPEARGVADELRTFLHEIEQADGLGESFCSFAGKLPGVHGRLMLVLHLVGDPTNGPSTAISEATARAAARIVREFVICHARALYATSADKADLEVTRAIYSYVLTSSKDRFVTSDFASGIRSLRGLDPWAVFKAVDPLVASCWLMPETDNAPAKSWTLAPGIREFFRERRASEIARKAEVTRIIRAAGECIS